MQLVIRQTENGAWLLLWTNGRCAGAEVVYPTADAAREYAAKRFPGYSVSVEIYSAQR